MQWETTDHRLMLFNSTWEADWWHNLPQIQMLGRSHDLLQSKEIMDEVRYTYEEGVRNELILIKRISEPPPTTQTEAASP
jgi:hypothetical protein